MGQHLLPGNIIRRDRYETTGPVGTLIITARILDKLQAFFTHGLLASDVLRALVEPHVTQWTTSTILKRLKRLDYIEQPSTQFAIKRGHANNLIFKISAKGVGALVDGKRITIEQAELWEKSHQNASNDIWHDVDTGYLTASIEIGCKKAGHRFMPWYELLTHPNCPQATRDADNPFKIVTKRDRTKSGKIVEHGNIPDAIFRIYSNGGYTPLIFLETDKGTEQTKASQYKHSTIASKIISYRHILLKNLHTEHFGAKYASIYIINDKLLRRQNMMKAALEIAREDTQSKAIGPFFFGCITELNRDNDEDPPTGDHVYTMVYKTPTGQDDYLNK